MAVTVFVRVDVDHGLSSKGVLNGDLPAGFFHECVSVIDERQTEFDFPIVINDGCECTDAFAVIIADVGDLHLSFTFGFHLFISLR